MVHSRIVDQAFTMYVSEVHVWIFAQSLNSLIVILDYWIEDWRTLNLVYQVSVIDLSS